MADSTTPLTFDVGSSLTEAGEGAGNDIERVEGDAAGDGTTNGDVRMELREMSKSMDKGLVELKEGMSMSFIESLASEISMHDWTEATRNGRRVGEVIRRAVYRKLDSPLRPQWTRRNLSPTDRTAVEADGFTAEVFEEGEGQAAAAYLAYHMEMVGVDATTITAMGLWPEMVFLVEVMADDRALSRAAKQAFAKMRSLDAREDEDPAAFARSIFNWAVMFPPQLPGVRFPSQEEVVDAATAAIEEHLAREFLPAFRRSLGRMPTLRTLRRAATDVTDLGAVFTKPQPPGPAVLAVLEAGSRPSRASVTFAKRWATVPPSAPRLRSLRNGRRSRPTLLNTKMSTIVRTRNTGTRTTYLARPRREARSRSNRTGDPDPPSMWTWLCGAQAEPSR